MWSYYSLDDGFVAIHSSEPGLVWLPKSEGWSREACEDMVRFLQDVADAEAQSDSLEVVTTAGGSWVRSSGGYRFWFDPARGWAEGMVRRAAEIALECYPPGYDDCEDGEDDAGDGGDWDVEEGEEGEEDESET